MGSIFDFPIDSTFSKELPADNEQNNFSRQVEGAFYSYATPTKPANPSLIHLSSQLFEELGIEMEDKELFVKVMSGEIPFKDFKSYAMCYGGHQFGQWAGQLGDGRAINIAELSVKDRNIKIQLKGAGPTPYSRRADGLAVLRSSIREYLCSEAMYNLGIPTTRALSIVKTGDWIPRDILYNGNIADEQGAIVARVSESFIRFGNFEIFASRQDKENLKKLADYTISHHFSELGSPSKETYLAFFKQVVNRTKKLMIHWQRVGFVHGVMNTDNMSILGQTIDYGPYGWLEEYNPGWTPNTTDAQHRRYRYGNQPSVALWNLTQLANALYPLIEDLEALQTILDTYKKEYIKEQHEMMCSKLGLRNTSAVSDEFIHILEGNLRQSEIDMTLFFRELSNSKSINFSEFWNTLKKVSYLEKLELKGRKKEWREWFNSYLFQLHNEDLNAEERSKQMKQVNPKYVLRNYMAQLAIDQAETGNYSLLEELYNLLQNPYADQPEMEKWYIKRPEWAKNKVGCSMLSCSS